MPELESLIEDVYKRQPNEQNGWVHKYELNTRNLKILDFQEKDVLSWLAEMCIRDRVRAL